MLYVEMYQVIRTSSVAIILFFGLVLYRMTAFGDVGASLCGPRMYFGVSDPLI